jgi:hypothetical protein
MSTAQMDLSSDAISRRAYELWEARGCPPGDGSEDWEAALAELTADHQSQNGSADSQAGKWWSRLRQKITGRDM